MTANAPTGGKMQPPGQSVWVWHLPAPPEALWPLLSDTARFNEAAGTPRYSVSETPRPDGSVLRQAEADYKGIKVRWEERPYEWVAGQSFRHERHFENGPLRQLGVAVALEPEAGGSRITYRLHAVPRGLLGHLLLLTGFIRKSGASIEAMLRQAAAHALGQRPLPFDYTPPPPPAGAAERLQGLTAALASGGYAHGLAEKLAWEITMAQEVDLVRMRPRRLAAAWNAPLRHVLELCLDATKRGMLSMSWNLLCPRCGGAKSQVSSLADLPGQAHCPSCNIVYDGDFASNVEIAFQPAPTLRPLSLGEFCMGGPHVSRHILVQQILAPGETRAVTADLPPGEYRLRALEPGSECIVTLGGGGASMIAEPADDAGFAIRPGLPAERGMAQFENRTQRTLTLVIESRAWRQEAVTAHEVTTMQAFRDLLPTQVLRPGETVAIEHVTLLFTDLEGSTALYERIGDGAAYRMVRRHFSYLAEEVRAFDGTLVKTIGDAVMAAFADPAQALRAALAVQRGIERFNAKFHAKTAREGQRIGEAVTLKMGLHGGRCIAVNLNDRLDYFGSSVNLAARLQGRSRGGEIVLSQALAADPAVAPLLDGLMVKYEMAELKGFTEPVPFLRLRAN
ncbi:adenylate/guanylate cyclase domain-containing protein [Ferrovibrio sp.]|uniref:adenylate/guanylate cyclase domain-containing protein n=1 Tax=Ferrovibrio sp. TaxID=1917215 RepID=UPI003D0E9933